MLLLQINYWESISRSSGVPSSQDRGTPYTVNSHPPCGIILPLTEHCYCSIKTKYETGDVSELADEHDLGSCAARREGSIPSVPIHTPSLRGQRPEAIRLS